MFYISCLHHITLHHMFTSKHIFLHCMLNFSLQLKHVGSRKYLAVTPDLQCAIVEVSLACINYRIGTTIKLHHLLSMIYSSILYIQLHESRSPLTLRLLKSPIIIYSSDLSQPSSIRAGEKR